MDRKIYLNVMIIVLLILCFISGVYAESYDKSWLIDRFNKLDSVINRGEGYSKSTNEATTLMWAQSYLFESYLDMYEATKDEMYLRKFINQADEVCKNTDKARGLRDYKGRLRTGWGVTKSSKGEERVVTVLSSGMILYPMMKFSFMVKEREYLSQYREAADRYVRIAEEAMSEFEGQWRFDRKTSEGSYWFEGDEPRGADLNAPMPFNATLAIGRVIIILYQLTGKESYLGKAKALALHFKHNLTEIDKGSYIWRYRPKWGAKDPKMEDISHGAIEVDFTVLAAKAGIVFTDSDLKKFSKTFIGTWKSGKFSMYVDGRDDEKNKADYSDASGRWLELSFWDCEVYKVVNEYMTNRLKEREKEHPPIMLGIAELIRFLGKCSK